MDKKRLRELSGLPENKEEILTEANIDTRLKDGPNFTVTVWKKTFSEQKTEFEALLNFSSFKLNRVFVPKDPPALLGKGASKEEIEAAFAERDVFEGKKVADLNKKVQPIVKRFISDLQKALKQVK